jgi:putative ABC transport system permease protein
MAMIVPILKIALRALARNKARSALTMLGIIIGVGSVIAMVSLGQGAQKQVKDQISNMGANLLIVQAGSQRTGGVRGGAGTSTTLTEDDMAAILRDVPAVAAASPSISASVPLVVGNQNWSTRAEGVDTSYPAIRLRDAAQGQFFTDGDVRSAARVAVIGQTVANVLFPGADPVGQTMRLRNLPFRVVGVLQARGQSQIGQDQDDTLLVPYTTVMKKLMSTNYISSIQVSAVSEEATAPAQEQITMLLRARHNIRAGQDDDFTVRNLSDVAETAAETSRVMTMLLGGIAAVSLLVGGIGIMNIMLVSVTERTREIGIRMAVGARSKHVQYQFLIEALILGLAGGLTGIAVGAGTSYAVSYFLNWPQLLSPVAMVGSALFSMLIGVFFGYYPARKAAALDPIEALRFE